MWTMGRVAAIADSSNVKQRGRQVNWMFGADHFGSLTSPLLGGVVADMAGIRAPFVLYGILALVAVIPSFWLVKETRPKGLAATSRSSPSGSIGTRWKANLHLLILPFLVLFAVDFLVAISRGPLYAGTFHLYAAYEYQLSSTMIGAIATAASALGLPISFTAGWVMDRYGRKTTMVPGFISLGIALLTVAATAYFRLPLEWYLAAFFFVAGSQALTGGSVQTLGADVAPPEARGKFLGLWRLVAQVGTVVSPTVFAFLADNVGYHASFVFLSLGTLTASFLLITRVRETLHQEPPKPAIQPDPEVPEPALVS
jgi:MFS family permease